MKSQQRENDIGADAESVGADLKRLRMELDSAQKQAAVLVRDWKKSYEAERRRAAELERSHYDALVHLIRVSRYRSLETSEHMMRVGLYSAVIGRHLGLGAPMVNLLKDAAPLHDLGKVGIPDSVLLFKGPLSGDQLRIMREHPRIGADLLAGSQSPVLALAAEIALTHHERWDGSGYPEGLKGKQIPVAGHITMLADAYDALRSPRPYKSGFTHQKACEIILEGDGRIRPEHFDPEIRELFRRCHQEFAEIYDTPGATA